MDDLIRRLTDLVADNVSDCDRVSRALRHLARDEGPAHYVPPLARDEGSVGCVSPLARDEGPVRCVSPG